MEETGIEEGGIDEGDEKKGRRVTKRKSRGIKGVRER